jgi:hypothetical protein
MEEQIKSGRFGASCERSLSVSNIFLEQLKTGENNAGSDYRQEF